MSNTSATGQGSAGNVIAAVCSFFVPGLGQLVQGRILAALLMFVLAGAVWLVSFGLLGWVMHLVACIEAARWKRR
jgi:TM2 domain-containing membrane protein YozV